MWLQSRSNVVDSWLPFEMALQAIQFKGNSEWAVNAGLPMITIPHELIHNNKKEEHMFVEESVHKGIYIQDEEQES